MLGRFSRSEITLNEAAVWTPGTATGPRRRREDLAFIGLWLFWLCDGWRDDRDYFICSAAETCVTGKMLLAAAFRRTLSP